MRSPTRSTPVRAISTQFQLNDYRLLGLVGQGQFAQVYCAIHKRTGKLVAIKQTRHIAAQASQEPFILYGLSHPNIVGCQAVAQTDTGYQLVLDYCEGGTLRSRLDTAGLLPFPEAKALITDILQGLAYLHKHQIIHGDLKPENIFLTYPPGESSTARARIGDFGCARFAEFPNRSKKEIGSPTYAAPERFDGHSSSASDLYAVGVMIYELLLGDRPFSGTPAALRDAHQTQPIPLPETLTQPAMQLLLTALQKQPQKRFSSAEALYEALQQLSAVYLKSSPPGDESIVPKPTLSPELITSIDADSTFTKIPLSKITFSVESLVSAPQGCYLITERSLHILTHNQQILPVAEFSQPCWTVVSPDGKWFVTLPKSSQRESQGYAYQLSTSPATSQATQTNHDKQNSSPMAIKREPITLTSPLLTALRSEILQVLAIDTRHLLRVRTVQHPERPDVQIKTYLECFTRRGQFIGQLSVNLPISHMTPTAYPYQFLALTSASDAQPAHTLLITLKPFQLLPLQLPIQPRQVSTFSWGSLLIGELAEETTEFLEPNSSHSKSHSKAYSALVLDRSANTTASLVGLPSARAIATLNDYQLVMATPASLVIADLRTVDLGLIF